MHTAARTPLADHIRRDLDYLAGFPGDGTGATQEGRALQATQAEAAVADWMAMNAPTAVPALREAGLAIWTPADGYGDGHPDE